MRTLTYGGWAWVKLALEDKFKAMRQWCPEDFPDRTLQIQQIHLLRRMKVQKDTEGR